MFDDTQVQSYKSITAPADLRQKVMTACESTGKVRHFSVPKAIYGVAPVAACLLLLIPLLMFGKAEPLLLNVGSTAISSEDTTLPPVGMCAAYGLRTASLEPQQYTVTLTGNQDMEVVSADGLAVTDEEGNISWTVNVPMEEMVYQLILLADGENYEVSLRYHVADGSFSVCYKEQ